MYCGSEWSTGASMMRNDILGADGGGGGGEGAAVRWVGVETEIPQCDIVVFWDHIP